MDTGGAVLIGGVNNFVPSQQQKQIKNKLSQANNFDVQPTVYDLSVLNGPYFLVKPLIAA